MATLQVTAVSDAKKSSKSPKHIICDPNGDRKIIAGTADNQVMFTISTNAMSLACKPWKAMLGKDGKFIEASESQKKPIPFPGDDVKALEILLNVTHLQFTRVPTTLTLPEFFKVAILCDKYDAVHLVQPWLSTWELNVAGEYRLGSQPAEWFIISRVFGNMEMFRNASYLLVENLKLQKSVGKDGRRVSIYGKLLNLNQLPPLMFDDVIKARDVAVESIRCKCYNLCARLIETGAGQTLCTSEESEFVTPAEGRLQCDAIAYFSLAKGLKELGLRPRRTDPMPDLSVQELANGVKSINIPYYLHFPSEGRSCGMKQFIQSTLDSICCLEIITASSVIIGSQINVVERQSKKCRRP